MVESLWIIGPHSILTRCPLDLDISLGDTYNPIVKEFYQAASMVKADYEAAKGECHQRSAETLLRLCEVSDEPFVNDLYGWVM